MGLLCLFLFSLSDRKPVESEDEIVVMVVPDYQMLGYVEKIASQLSDDPVTVYHLHRQSFMLPFVSLIYLSST